MSQRSLEQTLRESIRGEVRFDAGSRALYSTDGSNYRQVPIGVVIPKGPEDIIRTVALCREFEAPVLNRGGGTSLAGQCCNVAVVIDSSKYLNRLIEIDPDRREARVEPGLILDDLRSTAEKFSLTFGPDPATHSRCTLGGMIGNNSCGVHSLMSGKTAENIESMQILTYDGLVLKVGKTAEEELQRILRESGRRSEIYSQLKQLNDRYADLVRARFPRIPRRVSGYNLDELRPENGFNVARALVGSEGTCVTVLEATVRLVPSPPHRTLLVLAYPDLYVACDRIQEVLAHQPIGLEAIDDNLIRFMKKKQLHLQNLALLPDGNGWFLAEFGGGTPAEASQKARALMEELLHKADTPAMRLFENDRERSMVWKVRESALGATAFVPGDPEAWEGWEDAAVHPEKLGAYLRDLRKLMDRYHYTTTLYGHAGEGCVHTRINFDFRTEQGVRKFRSFVEEGAHLVVSHGGSISGEHGDGQARGELLAIMYGEELVNGFREFKAIWDPGSKMNPGKLIDANRLDDNLRIGPSFDPPKLKTHFHYPLDEGSFVHAAMRCVGVGECRKLHGGTMCPSFMVTREEKHSTRGRAHLLFEMLNNSPLTSRWKSLEVKEALDLCLSCKGCKSDCPAKVDLATYKAEFLSHYYNGSIMPIAAYTLGRIRSWCRIASPMAALVNWISSTTIAKRLAGVSDRRRIPRFARKTFLDWYYQRQKFAPNGEHGEPPPGAEKIRVLLWPDTFTNYFHPEIGIAAVEVLERLGCEVAVPRQSLCCGRPLYDYGMLDKAKTYLHQIVNALTNEIADRTPIVFLEPSCAAVFRDELPNLLEEHAASSLAAQSFLLAEFIENKFHAFSFPKVTRKAIVHGHCHQQALVGMESDIRLLERIGLDFEVLDSGCCGMAGAFGFEKDHYDISVAIGERVLLPAVRNAPEDMLIMTDGFSCREQILQCTGRRALHLAQVLQTALHSTA